MNTQDKIVATASGASELLAQVAELQRPLVFTNGCFDILHRGHTHYLEQARNLGQALVVGVNSDESVKRQSKGTDRPINPLADRMAILASLACVDLVVAFDDDTPLQLIRQVQPDHLVKGGDWPVAQIVGAQDVLDAGGEVHSLAFEFDRSTSDLIARIRA